MSELQPVGNPIELASELFKRFEYIYGYTWKKQHHAQADWEIKKLEWGRVLIELTREQFERGIDRCIRESGYAPGLPTFRALALGMDLKTFMNGADEEEIVTYSPAHKDFPPAEQYTHDPEIRRQGLARLREITAQMLSKKLEVSVKT